MRDLTEQEQLALGHLADAAHAVTRLPEVHPADLPEFAHIMHQAQNIILSRPAVEAQRART